MTLHVGPELTGSEVVKKLMMMNKIKDQKFYISPQNKQQSIKQLSISLLATCAVFLGISFYMKSFEFLFYSVTFIVVYYLLYFQTSRTCRKKEDKGWPCIMLIEDKLKIKQEDSLLWSKDISSILSAEVENNKFLFFTGKSLLIKSDDNDSYHLTLPARLSDKLSAEIIANAITERALHAQNQTCTSQA